MRCLLRIFVSLLLPAALSLCVRAQGPIAPHSAPAETSLTYPNSAGGLQSQLQDVLAAAKENDVPKLESLIKLMEIPDDRHWFAKTYGEDHSENLANAYERILTRNESLLERNFTELASEEGEFVSSSAGGAQPLPMESPAMTSQPDPADMLYVSWKNEKLSTPLRLRPIGSLAYIDGRFRFIRVSRILAGTRMMGSGAAGPRGTWSSTNSSAQGDPSANGPVSGPIQPGVHIDVRPTCDSCPAAEYSEAARRKGLEGTVVLQAIVQPDGSPTDIQVVKSPDPELAQMAINTVSKWRFKPARNTDGQPVAYREAIEVSFRLAK